MEDKIRPIKSFIEEASQPLAITLVGLPLSGKDTLIELLELENFTLISRDTIIGQHSPAGTYREAYSALDSKTVDKLFFKQLEEALIDQKSILLNATNLRKKRRRKINLRIPADYLKIAILLPEISMEVYERRNHNRREQTGKHISLKVYEEMKGLHEEVTEEEGFDRIFNLNLP